MMVMVVAMALQLAAASPCGLGLPPVDIDLPADTPARVEAQDYAETMERLLPIACELGRLGAVDQYAREILVGKFEELGQGSGAFKDYTDAVGPHLDAVDEVTTARLKEILEQVSWRDLATNERFLFSPAFHIVQHSGDDAFMAETLEEIEPLAKEGLVPAGDFAMMHDRFRLSHGQKQTYGTQVTCMDGERIAHDLDAPETVDRRRAEVGLGPLAAYIAESNEIYGMCASAD